MNKKWENPKLESLKIENTECGAWRYHYECDVCHDLLFHYGSEFEPETKPHQGCAGTYKMIARFWSDSYCDGTCS